MTAKAVDVTKLGLGGTLGLAARLFGRHIGTFGPLAFLAYLPIELVAYRVSADETDPVQIYITRLQVGGLLHLLIGMVAVILVVRLTANAVDGAPTSFGAVWRAAGKRYLSAVPTAVACSLVVSGLLVLLVIPGLLGLVYTAFYLQVPVLREDSGFRALKHSKAIVEGRFWSVAGYMLLLDGGKELLLTLAAGMEQVYPAPWLAVVVPAAADVLGLYFVMAWTILYLRLERTRFD